jgi:glycosyltransferase involved in cell wall biosynthesis
MTQAVRSILTSQPFDVVIASTQVMAAYALQAPQPVTRVIEEHNSMTRWMEERYREQDSPVQRLRCWLSWRKTAHHEARLFGQFQLCTMVSDQDRQTTLCNMSGYRGRVEVVPNGVDCQHHRPGLAQPRPGTLVYNGALTYGANQDAMWYFLTEIFPGIRQQHPEARLTITGSTSGVDLSALALNNSVQLTGYVDDVRVPVAEASVCVIPIRQGGGTRLKILEAMALGTPVVSTSKGAEGLYVTPGKDILIADKPIGFASEVVRLLQDCALRQRLAENARRLVEEHYDWSEIGRRFVDLVEEIAGQRVEGQPAR